MNSVRVIIHGQVQGVGYRWFARDMAEANAVSGWVRNRRDGTVEVELHGNDTAVAVVLTVLRDGPPHSRVDDLTVTEIPESVGVGFDIRPTV